MSYSGWLDRHWKILTVLLALVLEGPAVAEVHAALRQARGLWVVRTSLLSSHSIDRMVASAAQAGFDNLFVQVCGRADSYFPSKVYPPAENCRDLLATGFDPLAYTLERAHSRGIKVHAWVNTFLVWTSSSPPLDPSHLLNSHPEWMMVDRSGGSLARYSRSLFNKLMITGVFMSPASRGGCDRLEEFITDMVGRYPVDGVHLDYIRYPMEAVDYSPAACEGFKRLYGVDPRGLASGADNAQGESARRDLKKKWTAYRAGLITEFLQRLSGRLNVLRPGLVRSAAVKPNLEEAYQTYGQDWPEWVGRGYLDLVLPMAYSTHADQVHEQIAKACRAVGQEKVWAGLRAYDVPVSGIIERIRRIAPLKPGGYCFFSYDGVRDNQRFFEEVRRALSGP